MGNVVEQGSAGFRRPLRRRMFVPPECAGILAAVAAAEAGDDTELRRWAREAYPVLARALRRAGFDPTSADDAITYLLEVAHATARTENHVENGAAWIAAVLATSRARRRRADQREEAARRRLADRTPSKCNVPSAAEEREELLAAAARLTPRFAVAIRLRLRGLDKGEVRAALSIEFAVGPEQARKLDRAALAAMRNALAGASDGKNPDSSTSSALGRALSPGALDLGEASNEGGAAW